MTGPLVSVIIPAYNGGELLAEAIRSVLDQTYRRFELVVVDDASTDGTAAVVRQFTDPRVKLIVHSTNLGAHAARLSGVGASSGTIVAFLDQDDLFHPQKLEVHVEYLSRHPEVGFAYNPHYTLLHPVRWVTGIWRPPSAVTLADVLLGFPIPPSVWVVRREWVGRGEFSDESTRLRGAEVVICGRLLVSGCRFGAVDRVLNYRRIHIGRRFAEPAAKCREERLCQQILLGHPGCPAWLGAYRERAFAENCLVWGVEALAEENLEEGWCLVREAVRLQPKLLAGDPSRVGQFLLFRSLDEGRGVEVWLRGVFDRLPPELERCRRERDWSVRQAHLIAGARHAMWGRDREARSHFQRAKQLGAEAGDFFYRTVAYELFSYEREYGAARVPAVLDRLRAALPRSGRVCSVRRLSGAYHLCRAFHRHAAGERDEIPRAVLRAFTGEPRAMRNRGAWSILLQGTAPRWLTACASALLRRSAWRHTRTLRRGPNGRSA